MNTPSPFGTYQPKGLIRRIIGFTRALPDQWAARRLSMLMRRIALWMLQGRSVDLETFGARMRLYPYNNVCEKRILFTPQFFDAQERAILENHIRDGFVFIDIGANIGAYSLFVAARAQGAACILAVEPQPEIFDRLTYNIRQNPFGCIKAVACAVADKTGELTLFLDPRNRGESSVKVMKSSQSGAVRVPTKTLLDLIGEEGFTRIDAIKIDVEGAEDLILEPFFRDAPLSLYPSLIFLENGHAQWQIDLPKLLEEKGYQLVLTTHLNLVYKRA
jgi:FkbM family methyltransferase